MCLLYYGQQLIHSAKLSLHHLPVLSSDSGHVEINLLSGHIFATPPLGPPFDGGQQEEERLVSGENPSPWITLTYAVPRRLPRAFQSEENFDVPDILDPGQPLVRGHME